MWRIILFRKGDLIMIYDKKDIINSLISLCTKRRKSLGILQRWLRLRYHIDISTAVLVHRMRDLKVSL